MSTTTAPDRTEAAEYYFTYIDQVTAGDICAVLDAQLTEMLDRLKSISDEQSLIRYAPDKWSIRGVLAHVNDTERLFVFRAFWFARGFDSPCPASTRTSRCRRLARTNAPGGATSTSFELSAPRRSRSSGTCQPTRGRGAASPATIRSRCAPSRIYPQGM
jgi:hypothetical protein